MLYILYVGTDRDILSFVIKLVISSHHVDGYFGYTRILSLNITLAYAHFACQ